MQTLRAFFNHLHANAGNSVRSLWKYSSYDTSLGTREEVAFIGSAIILQMVPPRQELSLLVAQTQETRVYKHAAYLMSIACPFFLEEAEQLKIAVYGQGFQGFVGVNNVDVRAYNAEGIVERIDRFGQSHEHSITRIAGVTVTRKQKVETQ